MKSPESNQAIGAYGEALAERALIEAGYQIIGKNWRYKHCEIDFIAREGEMLVFVEVKARNSDRFGEPYEAVGHGKMRALSRAAQAYLREQRWKGESRFDIVSIVLRPSAQQDLGSPRLDIIKDAFWPG